MAKYCEPHLLLKICNNVMNIIIYIYLIIMIIIISSSLRQLLLLLILYCYCCDGTVTVNLSSRNISVDKKAAKLCGLDKKPLF